MSEERLKFAARFTELATQLGYEGHGRQTRLALYYHKKQPSVKKWFDGESQPDYEICVDICKRARVHYEWLMTGRGAKPLSVDASDSLADVQSPLNLPADTQAVMDMMAGTDQEGRVLIKNAAIDTLMQYHNRRGQLHILTSARTDTSRNNEKDEVKQSSQSSS